MMSGECPIPSFTPRLFHLDWSGPLVLISLERHGTTECVPLLRMVGVLFLGATKWGFSFWQKIIIIIIYIVEN